MQVAFDFYRDLPARPERPERLFFALIPDAETSTSLDRFIKAFVCENQLEGMQLPRERRHVSLHHVGDYKRLPNKFLYAARRAAETVSMQPFEMTFRSVKTFDGAPSSNGKSQRRPLVLLGEGDDLRDFHAVLGAAMKQNGLRAAKHFTPHMTLLYGSKPIPVQAIEPIRFIVKEFTLIHSELWLTRYSTVDRWALAY